MAPFCPRVCGLYMVEPCSSFSCGPTWCWEEPGFPLVSIEGANGEWTIWDLDFFWRTITISASIKIFRLFLSFWIFPIPSMYSLVLPIGFFHWMTWFPSAIPRARHCAAVSIWRCYSNSNFKLIFYRPHVIWHSLLKNWNYIHKIHWIIGCTSLQFKRLGCVKLV